jgi:hypothetical protein
MIPYILDSELLIHNGLSTRSTYRLERVSIVRIVGLAWGGDSGEGKHMLGVKAALIVMIGEKVKRREGDEISVPV